MWTGVLSGLKWLSMFESQSNWQQVRQSASQFRGSVGSGSLPLRVGLWVFFCLILIPLLVAGLLALSVAILSATVVLLTQRLINASAQFFSSSDNQGRRNVKIVDRK